MSRSSEWGEDIHEFILLTNLTLNDLKDEFLKVIKILLELTPVMLQCLLKMKLEECLVEASFNAI
ncbi:uncharacterized protein PHALS_01035 [Plasmopara halstedii]|uniref:Uncharacterized protein n=1 Tax=Plasmopara halstedii TaxID=4781 RepID=A0A0P1ASQ4_PLAHL|nr:uncharacterized protein PHALS_01035 [Plasmopara halstedii]CEG44688.1 hypothetical protein PHALS_01035 [Plasmopara halstedii]|eukprot:XP_024581057.1 hypothetical protein PHALS_01035 [Plasmopara halstedii]